MNGNRSVAVIVAVLLLASLVCNIIGVCGLASSYIFVHNMPWGVVSVEQPTVTGVTFTKFDIDLSMNIWGMCLQYDLEGTVSNVAFDEADSDVCASWGNLEDAAETGTAPSSFECDSTPRFCDAFMNYTAVDAGTREAFKDCKDSITGMQVSVIIALIAVVVKFVSNNPVILIKFPKMHARRNKCIKIVTYVLPIVTQSAGVAEYLSACYDDYDSATFTDRDIGVGCWCFIASIIICVLLLIIECLTPSTWPGELPAPDGPGDGWQLVQSKTGPFFYHPATQKMSWTLPATADGSAKDARKEAPLRQQSSGLEEESI